MSSDLEALVSKNSESRIRLTLSRSAVGLSVGIWAVSHVEDFMRRLGEESGSPPAPVALMGKYWTPATKDAPPLMVYTVTQPLDGTNPIDGSQYSLSRPGSPLVDPSTGLLNMSMLRLVGISEGSGVRFNVKGSVMSLEMLRRMKSSYAGSLQRFYTDFIRPVDLTLGINATINISTQELRM